VTSERAQETDLDKDVLARDVDPSKGVDAVGVEEAPAYRGRVVRHEHEAGVLRLGDHGEVVKPSVVVDEERLGVALLAADDVRAMEGVAVLSGRGRKGGQWLCEVGKSGGHARRRPGS